MKRNIRIAMLLLGLLVTVSVHAQDKRVFDVAKIADGLYELRIDAGGYPLKVIASVGDDGLLIVDSGSRSTGKALADALKTFGKGMPKIIINTHTHIEHLGGNIEVGSGAVIIAHKNVRDRYLNGLYAFGDFPASALPNLVFSDSLELHFNGEDIRLASFPGAHDNSDTVVWFTKSKVAVVGALCMCGHFPSIDGDVGDILKYPDVTSRMQAFLPDDVRLVPAHADDCTMAEGRRFLEMLQKTSAIVRAEMAKGKDSAHMKAADVLAAYESFESSYVKRNDWLEYWYDAYSAPRSNKPRPYAPVVQALQAKGANAAVDVYSQLKRSGTDEYWFEDMALMYMGRRLARLGRNTDAAVFLDRCVAEYPGTEGAAISHDVLATLFAQLGNIEKASEHERAYLQRHPEDQSAKKRLADFEDRLKNVERK